LGYRNYADDLALAFVERAAENGMDIFRTFDALNDYRNFETVVSAIKECGKHFQGCICYTVTEPRLGGEIYNIDYYVSKARELEAMGVDSICIKDMAGIIAPFDAYDLVKALKEAVKAPIHLHTHFTSGMSPMSQLKAVEAGLDIVDTCMSPYAYRTSHAAIEPLVMTLLGTNRDTGFDIRHLAKINEILEKKVLPKYKHLLDDSKVSIIDINVLLHQIPGGMLSNLVNQLRELDALNRIDDVYRELPRVRKELGQIPLVTPTSQIVGVQTVNNVLFDDQYERYKMITDQVKDLCYGLYGKTTIPVDPEVQKKALKGYSRGEEPITCRPAEVLEPELENAKKDIGELTKEIDDVITYALYPITGRRFLKWKYGMEDPPPEVKARTLEEIKAEDEMVKMARQGLLVKIPDKEAPAKDAERRTFDVFVDDEYFEVEVQESGGMPLGSSLPQMSTAVPSGVTPHTRSLKPVAAPEPAAPTAKEVEGTPLTAPMPGMIVKYLKTVGDSVEKGEDLVILEAMKMENALPAPAGGTIKKIYFTIGDSVAKDDVLCVID